jgi:phytoene dehydrogenase-like protein
MDGSGSLAQRLAEVTLASGSEIRTGAAVAKILTMEERACGVVLEHGEEIRSTVVVSSADARTTFLKLVDPHLLEPTFLWQVQKIRCRGAASIISLALGALPVFPCLKGDKAALRGLTLIAPSLDYLEQSSDAAKYGDYSPRPVLEIAFPTIIDPSLAPPGKHIMSVLVQHTPYRLRNGDWKAKREELGEHVLNTLSLYAPNLKSCILDRRILTPLDLEEIYGLPEGNLFHGEPTLDQLFFLRPVPGWAWHRTPVRNLYLCGSSAHPGGGVMGMSGRNAATQILKDLKILNRR